jgi:predicted ATPase
MDAAATGVNAIDLLVDLVAKSLVVADVGGTKPRFRLLDTTRAYALEKLDVSGEREAVARRHGAYYRQLFARAEAEASSRTTSDWLADYAQEIDNLRAALDWALSATGEESTGVALTASAFPLWTRLSLLEECRRRAQQALIALGTESNEDSREAMRLHAALGASTSEASEMAAAFAKTLEIARRLGDRDYQLRALRGLFFYHVGSARFRTARLFAQEFHALALLESDRNDLTFAERTMGLVEYFVGDQMRARRHLEQALALDALGAHGGDPSRFRDVVRFGTDLRLSAQVYLARVLWLQGFADQAVRMVEKSLGEAAASGHAVSQCYVLATAACPVAFWTGDEVAAARYTVTLIDLSRQHVLPHWSAYGVRFERALAVKAGGLGGDSPRRPGGQEEWGETNFSLRSVSSLLILAEAFGQVGQIAEGLALLEAGIEQFEASSFTPELVRLKGELSLLQGMPGAEEAAEDRFRQAIDEAREYGAMSWELRAATSLARLLRDQGRSADATACLQPIYDRFTEGFGTADLIAARQLLDDLGRTGHH